MLESFAAALALLLAAACSAPRLDVEIPALPDDVHYGALWLEDANGELIAATEVLARRFGETFRIEQPAPLPDAALIRFAGWTEPALAPVLPGDRAQLRGAVARAGKRDHPLPRASWTAAGAPLDDSSVVLEPAGASPTLTAPWLPPCPLLFPPDEEELIDINCAVTSCPAQIEQTDCRVSIDATICNLGLIEGAIEPSGRVSFPESPLGTCATPEELGNAESTVALECLGASVPCRIDIYEAPLPHRFRTRTVNPAFAATIIGLAPLGELIAAGTRHDFDSSTCGNGAEDELAFLDAESMSVERTARTRPCLAQITPDPIGPGLIAIFGESARAIARFDLAGVEVQAHAIDIPQLTAEHFAIRIASEPGDPPTIAVGYRAPQGSTLTQYLVSFDANTLDVRTVTPLEGKITEVVALPGDRVGVLVDDADRVFTVDLAAGGAAQPGPQINPVTPPRSKNMSEMTYLPASDRFLVSSRGVTSALFVVDGNLNPGAAYFERLAEPAALSPWPPDPRLALVGLVALDQTHAGVVALFDPDPRRPRYLPGSEVIGLAEPQHAIVDARGRVWFALPGTGEIARVEAP